MQRAETRWVLNDYIQQGFPNWGTCTPSGTFAYLKWYI